MESNSTKPVKSHNSTMSISNLPDDAIADVLSRLPVKSIAQLRCVCKSWSSLISSPHFVKFHLNRVVNDVDLIRNRVFLNTSPYQSFDCDYVDDRPVSLDFLSRVIEPDSDVVGSCNGLLCVALSGDSDRVVVLNPTVRAFVELPKPSVPMIRCIRYGFGYDSVMNDYKLLRVCNPNTAHASDDLEPVLAEIFSFRNGCWRRIDGIPPSYKVYRPGVFFKGALHWLLDGANSVYIVAFNLGTEQFDSVLSFPGPEIKSEDCRLVVMQGCISVACNIYPDVEIWAMKEYGVEDSWTEICTILDDEYLYEEWMKVICGTKNGEVVLEVDSVDLVIYNPQQSTFRRIGIEGDEWFESVPYFETLVSPRIGP